MAPKLNPNRTPFTPLHLCLFLLLVIITTISTLSPSSPSSYHSLFLALSSNSSASTHLRHLTVRPHIASSPENSLAASYVLSSLPFPSHSVFYSVLLSFPLFRSLSLSSPHINFPLTQIPIPFDPSAAFSSLATPTYLAYSASNSVSAPVVYANYGRVEDFQQLLSLKVNVTGTIILAKYGKIYRGDIVKNAQDFGAAGVVIYSDPKDYNKDGETFPDGLGLPETGVQIGSTFRGLGDPLTPGWTCAANENGDECERVKTEEVVKQGLMMRIPALPLSGKDGEEIHRAIGGQVAPDDWQGRDDAPVYRVGPGPGVLNLTYIGNETLRTIQNVFGVIEGKEEPDRYVLLGNHRDAWTFGAVDPNSGTAALLELAERLSKLQKRGWKPRRTIILCNWDAEEFGSTEWVEENREMLSSRAVAYLNVDSSVYGPKFYASATPQLDPLIIHASKMVKDPDNSSQTVYDSWVSSTDSPPIGRLGGGGSDFAAFVQHIGVPSVDMSFGDGYIGYPVYHSLYDDYLWMEKFGDPFFQRHIAAASIWGLIALRLADDEILPFDYVSYAWALKSSTEEIEKEAIGNPVNFTLLYRSIQLLNKSALKITDAKKDLERKVWGINLRKNQAKIRDLNDRLIMAERAFTDRDGLSGREWYKHLIYGPTRNNDYGSKSFPGIDDAIEFAKKINTTESWRFVQHEIYRVARAIKQASLVLNGGLT